MATLIDTPATPATPDAPRVLPQDLLARYQQGKEQGSLESDVVQAYLPLVKHVVGRLAISLPSHVDYEDLYSAGMVGLLNAIRNFDPQGGSSFESYARVRIRGSVFDELRRMDWVPRSIHDKARRVQSVMQKIEQIKGRIPTDAEVARELNLSLDEYEKLMDEIRPATFICLDAAPQASEDSDETSHKMVANDNEEDPQEQAARRELAKVIAERLEQLPEVQRKVLALYYFEDMRMREIAGALGVTESRVCQIHSQAILAIRSYLRRFEDRIA
jgi:RNA polymerase sigma factor for flagellar operon FliA